MYTCHINFFHFINSTIYYTMIKSINFHDKSGPIIIIDCGKITDVRVHNIIAID